MSAAQETVTIDDIYRDPTTEHWLDGWGVTYYLTMIDVAQIDFSASRLYQNRGGVKTVQEHVDAIANMMADPAYTVAPLVVTQTRRGALLVIDGNHRGLAAVKANRGQLHAYIVKSDEQTLGMMAMAANARNAQHLTNEMRNSLIVGRWPSGCSTRLLRRSGG